MSIRISVERESNLIQITCQLHTILYSSSFMSLSSQNHVFDQIKLVLKFLKMYPKICTRKIRKEIKYCRLQKTIFFFKNK